MGAGSGPSLFTSVPPHAPNSCSGKFKVKNVVTLSLAFLLGWMCANAFLAARKEYELKAKQPEEVLAPPGALRLESLASNGTNDVPKNVTYPYHLVITGCERPSWARYWAHLLLTAWLNDVNPTSVTVQWCSHEHEDFKPPSLWYNLRQSSKFKIRFLPKELEESTTSTYYSALTVPDYLGQPDIPLIVVEDDIVFGPNFTQMVTRALNDVYSIVPDKPFMLSLYNPGLPGNVKVKIEEYERTPEQNVNYELRRGKVAWGYGVQCIYYSVGMVKMLKGHFEDIIEGRKKPKGYQDMILYQFMYEEANGCTNSTVCEVFGVRPSLAEHIGAASAVFGTNNSRFHLAEDFTMKVAFPVRDPPSIW